jgi:hypothetical protein
VDGEEGVGVAQGVVDRYGGGRWLGGGGVGGWMIEIVGTHWNDD